MGMDDAAGDCPDGHDYALTALLVVDGRLRQVQTCSRCGAPAL